MIKVRPILFVLGLLLCILAAAMVLPAIIDIADNNSGWQVFVASALLTFFIGGLLVVAAYEDAPVQLGVKEGFLLTTLCWLTLTAFSAVPFVGLGLSYSDAFFEAMSGLTTTGSTVLVGLDQLPRGILLWRALLQGVGGLGIIAMAIIILPFLRVGGMQLFHAESSDRSEKVMPRALELTIAIAGIYLLLLVMCTTAYVFFGMTLFDAVCHALTTVSTAGFSTHDASFGFFQSAALEWTCIVFMIAGALPFVIYIKMARGQSSAISSDTQVRGFLMFLFSIWFIVAFWLGATRDIAWMDALRAAAFNVTSIITTTGYVTEDFTAWGTFAFGLFYILYFFGGCSGSTTGGVKIYRLQVAGMLTRSHFLHLISPNRIVTLVYSGRRLPDDVPFSVIAFLAIYMATVGVFTVILSAMGLDFITALSSATQAVGNVGPGLGEYVGPSGSFSSIPTAAKWVLSAAMLLGRLELFTVLVLLRPEFWRT